MEQIYSDALKDSAPWGFDEADVATLLDGDPFEEDREDGEI